MRRFYFISLIATLSSPTSAQSVNEFRGFYAAVTGGYDFKSLDESLTRSTPFSKVTGEKIGGIFGYSAAVNSAIIGIEARSQYSFAQFTERSGYAFYSDLIFPSFVGSLTCYSCSQTDIDNFPLISGPPITTSSSINKSTKYTRPWQSDISLRFGTAIGDWMPFVKFGGGVEQSIVTTTSSSSYTNCTPQYAKTQTGPQSLRFDLVGCNAAVTYASTFGSTTRYYSPIAIFGAGVEHNIGNYFVRAEAEMTAHLIDWGTTYYSPSANISVGLRF